MILANVNLEELRIRYETARPQLSSLVELVEEQLRDGVIRHGISSALIEGRVKTTSSFLKKAMRKSYDSPWTDIRDKAGVRVTTTSYDDISVVETVVQEEFEILHYEDKRLTLQANQFDYLASHFEVVAPDANLDPGERICEIQVRTWAESAWAAVAHDLLYRVPTEPAIALRRSLYRLVALVELFDVEVARTKKEIMENSNFPLAQLLAGLEDEFLRLTAKRSDSELSRILVENLYVLLPTGGWIKYQPILKAFITKHDEKLKRIYKDYLNQDRIPLVSQPESLMVFERLENDRFRLTEHWIANLPESLLESMGEIWGTPINVA